MRGFLVIFTFYCEASLESILINAQSTRRLSQSILEPIKYTNQDAQAKLTNAITGYLGFFSPPLGNPPLSSWFSKDNPQRTKEVIDQQTNLNTVIETLNCSYKSQPLHVLAASWLAEELL